MVAVPLPASHRNHQVVPRDRVVPGVPPAAATPVVAPLKDPVVRQAFKPVADILVDQAEAQARAHTAREATARDPAEPASILADTPAGTTPTATTPTTTGITITTAEVVEEEEVRLALVAAVTRQVGRAEADTRRAAATAEAHPHPAVEAMVVTPVDRDEERMIPTIRRIQVDSVEILGQDSMGRVIRVTREPTVMQEIPRAEVRVEIPMATLAAMAATSMPDEMVVATQVAEVSETNR